MTLDQARLINKTHAALAVAIYRDWRDFIHTTRELAEFVMAEIEFGRATTLARSLASLEANLDSILDSNPAF